MENALRSPTDVHFPVNRVLVVLLALNFLLRLWVVARPLEYLDGLTIPDDTYLSLTLARNISRGLGPSYAGEPTNGFQPLSVFLMVPVFLAVPNSLSFPVHAATALSAIFDTLTLLLLCRIAARHIRSSFTLPAVALAWILNPAGIRTATNGMETSMACFFLTWGLWILEVNYMSAGATGSRRASLALGAVIGLGMLARIDVVLFGAVAVATMLAAGRTDLRKTCREAIVVIVTAFLLYIPWLLYSFSFTGDLYPVSGRAVRFMSLATVDFSPTFRNWYSLILRAGLNAVATTNNAVLLAGGAALGALLVATRGSVRSGREKFLWLAPASAHAILLFAAYTLYIFGPWFFERYLFPTTIVLFLILAALVDSLVTMFKRQSHTLYAITAVAALVVTLDLVDPDFKSLLFRSDTTSMGYMNAGIWARRTFAPGTVIGSAQSGALGYFADSLTVINLDGVVSSSCYEALLRFRCLSFLRERRVQYVIGWYSNFQYLEHQSEGMTKSDLHDLRKIDGLTSWGYNWYFAKVAY